MQNLLVVMMERYARIHQKAAIMLIVHNDDVTCEMNNDNEAKVFENLQTYTQKTTLFKFTIFWKKGYMTLSAYSYFATVILSLRKAQRREER